VFRSLLAPVKSPRHPFDRKAASGRLRLMNADDENSALHCWPANPPSIRVRGRQTRAGIRDSGSDVGGGAGAGAARRPEALYVGRCRGGALPEQNRHLGTLGGWAGWRGHTAGWSDTPVTGPTPTSGASVSGCASAAAKSPISRSTRGLRSSTSQTSGVSRSAGVSGAVRLSHTSCINGVRGSMSVRSNTSASAAPAVAVARRNTPATCHGSVDHLAPRRAAADRAARHSLGASTSAGTRFSFRRVASVSVAEPQMTASDETRSSASAPGSRPRSVKERACFAQPIRVGYVRRLSGDALGRPRLRALTGRPAT
jgi:hypothetical protein